MCTGKQKSLCNCFIVIFPSLRWSGTKPTISEVACILLEQLTELREMFSYIYQFIIKGIIKDTDERPDEEVNTRFRRALSTGASVPMELQYTTHPECGCVLQPRSSSNLVVQEFS